MADPKQEFRKDGVTPLSMTPSAIKSRQERRDITAEKVKAKAKAAGTPAAKKPEEETPEEETPEVSSGKIGVQTPEGAAEEDTHICGNCRGAVKMGESSCTVCGESLHWDEL